MKLTLVSILQFRITGYRLIIAAAAVTVFGLISHFVLIPTYREITSFTPFDVQVPLSQFMIAVELGAFAKGAATNAYILFAMIDLAYAITTAWMFTLVWQELFSRAPTQLFAFLTRGSILWVPSYVVILDLVAKAGFLRLIQGTAGPPYIATIEFCSDVHRLKFAIVGVRNYLTAAFALIAAFEILSKLRSRHSSSGSAFPS